MTAVILQARLDSSRLPRKAMFDLSGKPILSRVMDALRLVRADLYILACDPDSVPEFTPLSRAAGFTLFEGPKEDVLRRYCLAIREYKVDTVVRATGDNPLVAWDLANSLLETAVRDGADYAGHVGMPVGMGVEVIKADSLLLADAEAVDPFEREHVAPFLYRRPERFRIVKPQVPSFAVYESGRVTVDTSIDYERVAHAFKAVYTGSPPGSADVVRFLKTVTEMKGTE